MLQLIRDRATGWIAWGIIILICVPFALWGIYDYLSPTQSVAVATVNGTEIGYGQYQQAYQRHRARLQQLFGGTFDVNQIDESVIREQSIETLVNDEVLVQAARADGMRISDVQLARAIQVQETFQNDGSFSQDYYEAWLRSQGYSPGAFEYDLRRSMLSEQLLSGVGGSAIITSSEKDRMYRLLGQTRTYKLLEIPSTRYEAVQVADDEIIDYFEANAADFFSTEEVDLEYVVLSVDSLSSQIQVNEADLRSVYESTKLNYTKPEQRRARHILLRLASDAEPDAAAEVEARLAEIRKKLDAGESFEQLAKDYSDDPGSSNNGGDLGFFERGDMVPEFESAAFAMQVGQISEPVRSSFGFHLIELNEISAAATKSFDEVRTDITEDYRRSQAEQLYFERVESLANLAFDVPDSLAPVAEELGLRVESVSSVPKKGLLGHPVAGLPTVVSAVFDEDVLINRNNSDIVQLPDSAVAVVRVAEYRPAKALTLEQARPEIEQRLVRLKASELAKQDGKAILEELRAAVSPEQVASAYELEWQHHADVRRDEPTSNTVVLQRVFSMNKPGDGDTVYSGVENPDGSYAVIALSSVADGDPKTMSSDERAVIESELVGDFGRVAYDAYLQALKSESDIEISDEAVSSY